MKKKSIAKGLTMLALITNAISCTKKNDLQPNENGVIPVIVDTSPKTTYKTITASQQNFTTADINSTDPTGYSYTQQGATKASQYTADGSASDTLQTKIQVFGKNITFAAAAATATQSKVNGNAGIDSTVIETTHTATHKVDHLTVLQAASGSILTTNTAANTGAALTVDQRVTNLKAITQSMSGKQWRYAN